MKNMTTQQHIGVKAIIVHNGKILFIKRSDKYDHLKDAWDIPGGRINFGEDPEQGLRREIREETNLELEKIEKIIDVSTVFKNEEKHIVRITYLCTVKQVSINEIKLSGEHTAYGWLSPVELKEQDFNDKLLFQTLTKHFQL